MKKLEWETKRVKVSQLKLYDLNPRKISEDKKQKLINSLNKYNLVEIPAVNTDMGVIGGNQRVVALRLLGRDEEEIDVRYPNRKLSEMEVKEYAIISNTHAGEFDFEILDLEFGDVDYSGIGFDIPGLDEWKKKIKIDVKDDDFDVPKGGLETDIVEGDIFEIGDHKLLCGDSTNSDNWRRLIGEGYADLVLTDPPYNVDYVGKTKEALKIIGDAKSDGDFYKFLYDFFTSLGSYVKKGAAWYVWHADTEGANFRFAMKNAGIEVKQCLVWVKNSMVMGRQDYHWKHEPCLYGWKVGVKHGWYSDRTQTTVLNFDRPTKSKDHPTMKPIPLLSYQINNSSKVGDIIVDGFGGSGSTMVAAHQLERKCLMMELDPRYCQVVVNRMKNIDSNIDILKNGRMLW